MEQETQTPHKRRVRYKGKYPRKFEEKYKEFLVKYENHRMMADAVKRYEKIYKIIDSITYNHKEKICTLALTQIPSEEDINQYKMLCGIE